MRRSPPIKAVLLIALAVLAAWPSPALSQGHQLEACSRGRILVCQSILDRPRLAPGTRAAIEFLLTEIEAQLKACEAAEPDACASLARRFPDVPPPDIPAGPPEPPAPR